MNCQNPEKCKSRSDALYKKMEDSIDFVQNLVESFTQKYEEKLASIIFDSHAIFRENERMFSKADLIETVTNGSVMEAHYDSDKKEYVLLIWYFLKMSKCVYRPCHVRVKINMLRPSIIKVLTVYDPRSMPTKWNSQYNRRVCSCKQE